MIVTCPNCAARYRLSDTVPAKPARLRCAACDHRWVPEAPPAVDPEPPAPAPAPLPARVARGPVSEADEEAAFLAVQEQMRARWQDAATPVTPVPAPSEPADDFATSLADEPLPSDVPAPPRTVAPVWRTIIAIIAGSALAIAAAGLWIGRQDLSGVPVVGPALETLAPPTPVVITVTGTTTRLPSGREVLEVNGTIANPTTAAAAVPALNASLSGPEGMALSWTIPAPRTSLPPGQQVAFTSTVTGFPASAKTLTVSAAP